MATMAKLDAFDSSTTTMQIGLCVKFPNNLDVANLQFKELCPDLFLEIQLAEIRVRKKAKNDRKRRSIDC